MSTWPLLLTSLLGALLTIVYDQTGTHYSLNHTAGLSIYTSYPTSQLLYNQPTLAPFNLTLPSTLPSLNTTSSSSNASSAASIESYTNILTNPNAPWGLPSVTADYTFLNGFTDDAYKMIDGLLWYDTPPGPDNYWTNNQSSMPWDVLTITLPRARTFSSLSLATIDDSASGGVLTCPAAIEILDTDNNTLATHNPWTECQNNALNTVTFTNGSVTTSGLQVRVLSQIYKAVAISEMQIWAPSTPGPRYEVEDGLVGTFIGGFLGRPTGLNASVVDGGVRFPGKKGGTMMSFEDNAWVEVANVRSGLGAGGQDAGWTDITVVGNGTGSVLVQLNFLWNSTITFGGNGGGTGGGMENQTLHAPFLAGGNVVTLLDAGEGVKTLDAFVVG